jgi:hypothetical protein
LTGKVSTSYNSAVLILFLLVVFFLPLRMARAAGIGFPF